MTVSNDWAGVTKTYVTMAGEVTASYWSMQLVYILHNPPHLFLLLELESPTSSRLFDMSAGCIENVEVYLQLQYPLHSVCIIIVGNAGKFESIFDYGKSRESTSISNLSSQLGYSQSGSR